MDLKYYDFTQNNVWDIVHDGFEGWWPYIIKAVANGWISQYHLDCLLLNRRIENYDYGLIDSKSKPTGCFTPETLRNVAIEKKLH